MVGGICPCHCKVGIIYLMVVLGANLIISEDQFWDTVVHELYHCQQSILDYYNVSKDSEDAAWTYGYLMRKAVQLIGEPCMREA